MRRTSAAVLAAAMVCGAATAAAFELQVAPSGAQVSWQQDEVLFDLSPLEQMEGKDAAARDEIIATAQRVLETWSAAGGPVLVEGTATGQPTASIRWADKASDAGVERDVLAVTHLQFDADTGTISHAEIVINGARFRWATGNSCTDAFDLESTLAHEVGHALGLRHSAIEDATMFTRPAPCARERRDLALDDLDAITALYPATPPAADSADEPTMGGCSATSRGASGTAAALLLLAALALTRSRSFARR